VSHGHGGGGVHSPGDVVADVMVEVVGSEEGIVDCVGVDEVVGDGVGLGGDVGGGVGIGEGEGVGQIHALVVGFVGVAVDEEELFFVEPEVVSITVIAVVEVVGQLLLRHFSTKGDASLRALLHFIKVLMQVVLQFLNFI